MKPHSQTSTTGRYTSGRKGLGPIPRRSYKKQSRRLSPRHLKNVRELPSCLSGRTPCHPHHLMIKDERGVGMKATDRWVIPLTWDEHAELHTHGSKEHDTWFA